SSRFITFLKELNCYTEVRVRRGTTYLASPGEQLHVNCPVMFCSDSPPTVTWRKVYEGHQELVSPTDQIQTWWRSLTENSGIAVLWFTDISADDAGVYCVYQPPCMCVSEAGNGCIGVMFSGTVRGENACGHLFLR
uniref:Ig-like domain-containing protein n=1 Tax=Myripristis murdjan TaxID=586833 RepID=A0A668A4P1_9TELE